MNVMLKRTKSANKSVIAEATNHRDTAHTLDGREQCDEDDYGYESNASKSIYDKLMAKYEASPEDPMAKFSKAAPKSVASNLNKIKQRVLNGLNAPDDDKPVRSRSSHGGSGSSRGSDEPSSKRGKFEPYEPSKDSSGKKKKKELEEEARRKRLANANRFKQQNMSFAELQKAASAAKDKPKNPGDSSKGKEKGEEGRRPMTKKQREEWERERLSWMRKTGKLPAAHTAAHLNSKDKNDNKDKSDKNDKSDKLDKNKKDKGKDQPPPQPVKKKPVIEGPEFHPAVMKSMKRANPTSSTSSGSKASSSKSSTGSSGYKSSSSSSKRPRSRSPSPVGYRSSKSYNRIDSDYSEDEYDEDDDFIDDSEATFNVSAEIGKIFGYDKRKYAGIDEEDDRSMEVNSYASVMKEEARSARIGKQEDLEDMRREEEEKRRKKMKKKMRR